VEVADIRALAELANCPVERVPELREQRREVQVQQVLLRYREQRRLNQQLPLQQVLEQQQQLPVRALALRQARRPVLH